MDGWGEDTFSVRHYPWGKLHKTVRLYERFQGAVNAKAGEDRKTLGDAPPACSAQAVPDMPARRRSRLPPARPGSRSGVPYPVKRCPGRGAIKVDWRGRVRQPRGRERLAQCRRLHPLLLQQQAEPVRVEHKLQQGRQRRNHPHLVDQVGGEDDRIASRAFAGSDPRLPYHSVFALTAAKDHMPNCFHSRWAVTAFSSPTGITLSKSSEIGT